MNRKIKLIWDFKGPAARKTAEHHAVHLNEYSVAEQLDTEEIATQHFSEFNTTAYMVVDEKDMLRVRDTLKPHRAEVFKNNL
ncbi:MAG: hypothetical protein HKN90_05985 [Flavobacteriaceae bacterium]|nr:hypothetical protein [Flavobacteriaceae bacterium]